jgi:hypothetical protein
MRLVATKETLEQVAREGGELSVWPQRVRCCGGGWWILECATTRPSEHTFSLLHDADGVRVWAATSLGEPAELHVDTTRRGRLRAYWNGLAWVEPSAARKGALAAVRSSRSKCSAA